MAAANECPKITIVTPNLNLGNFLEATIRSVLSQGYPNLEYIVMDGGSSDTSVEVIKRYASELAFWESGPDEGLYHAVETGFARSSGDIMAWLNSDDMLQPRALFTVGEIFRSFADVQWLTGHPSLFDVCGRTTDVLAVKRWSKYEFYTGHYQWIQQESTFWRRGLWERAGAHFDTTLRFAGDLELWARFFRHSRLFSTTALLGGFRQRGKGQLSEDHALSYAEEARVVLARERLRLPSNEARRLRQLRRLQWIEKCLRRAGVVDLQWFRRRKIEPLVDYAPLVAFDAKTQSFTLRV
jgi:glycosyltransferase involved in cell wall biosynthesis